ncbi:unnamed protein product [Didymodactylos carnosus]|uniref:MULE transposase domain-containing protein n=1 Tax=Didymodactylos carnosus TaxID=1234261 RepID=A0A815YZE8_9BILA|nr:unnamed protein product [Didymodactylos carnosus]CAF1577904.1 unnamed protein product [Didymodactylos carnosus]CAF4284269.1 unnamed protein product [Didymodactylos carnosus]CAF4444134.1 unnamed protein product [Didymodactylos carnosus]
MIFGSEWSIRSLSSCSLWHSDGTFKVRPLLFEQLYIIFGFQNGSMIPCAYCLTTRKNSVVYTKILRHLIEYGKKLTVEMNPQRLTCDFEQATINSFVDIFPHIKINGCFFHHAQSLWRKIQKVGMVRHFEKTNDNNNVIPESKRKKADHWFLAAVGLALVPPTILRAHGQRSWIYIHPIMLVQQNSMII